MDWLNNKEFSCILCFHKQETYYDNKYHGGDLVYNYHPH